MIHFIGIYMFTVESKSAVSSAIADTSNCQTSVWRICNKLQVDKKLITMAHALRNCMIVYVIAAVYYVIIPIGFVTK